MELTKQKAEKEKMDTEIKELENQLGLVGRDSSALYYDPYYRYNDLINRDKSRKGYLESLKRKIAENYQSPDIILAVLEVSDKTYVSILADRGIYDMPPHTKHSNAKTHFDMFHILSGCEFPIVCPRRLYTLSECGRYEDYFAVEIPGTFECENVGLGNETIKQFVEDSKKRYRKA